VPTAPSAAQRLRAELERVMTADRARLEREIGRLAIRGATAAQVERVARLAFATAWILADPSRP
jgi:hypothetical protein